MAPLLPLHDWEAVKAFARGFAEAMAAEHPDRFTSKMSKAGRAGRIFVDWLRNQRGATAIAQYPGATSLIAAPMSFIAPWRAKLSRTRAS